MWLLDRLAGFLAALCDAFEVTPESILMHKKARLGGGAYHRVADHSASYYFAACRMMGTLIRRP